METASTSQVLSRAASSLPPVSPALPVSPTELTGSCSARTVWNFTKGGNYPLQVEEISFRGTDSLICLRSQDGTLWKKSCTGTVAMQVGDTVNAQLKIANPVLFQSYE